MATRKTRTPRSPAAARGVPENKRRALLDAAAKYFARHGFEGASMRDIATAVGMLSGSVYYHFPSKEALLMAVHDEGVQSFMQALEAAVAAAPPHPWDRLEAACVAHLNTLLGGNEYAHVVAPQFTHTLPSKIRRRLIEQRDAYEAIFAALVDALDLPAGTSPRYLRLTLLGSLNWTMTWYREGPDSPADIARKMVQLFRMRLDRSAAGR